MGAAPSRRLYDATVAGDVAAMRTALEAGADVNARVGKRDEPPLLAAARKGRLAPAQLLLHSGALDLKDSRGATALHVAAKHGHVGLVALLLDRGADVFATDRRQFRAMDLAALRGRAPLLRMMETRTCPFAWELVLQVPGTFSGSWRPSWVAVHRARPWDNPAMPRGAVILCAYEGRSKTLPLYRMGQPALRPLDAEPDPESAAAGGSGLLVTFELASPAVAKRGGTPRALTIRCRAPADVFDWFSAVLSEGFASGRGPAFDEHGAVLLPHAARQLALRAGTDALTAEAGLSGQMRGLPRAMTPAQVAALQRAAGARGGGARDHGLHAWQSAGPLPAFAASMAAAGGAARAPDSAQRAQGSRVSSGVATPLSLQAQQQQQHPRQSTLTARSPASARGASAGASVGDGATATTPGQQAHPGGRASSAGAAPPAPPTPRLEDLAFDSDPPGDYLCPITMELMASPVNQPVVAADGHTYSKAAITRWLLDHRSSPKTNELLADGRLVPNHLLRGQILTWVEEHRCDRRVTARASTTTAAAAAGAAAPGGAPPSSAASVKRPAAAGQGEEEEEEQEEGDPSSEFMQPRAAAAPPTALAPAASAPSTPPAEVPSLDDPLPESRPSSSAPAFGGLSALAASLIRAASSEPPSSAARPAAEQASLAPPARTSSSAAAGAGAAPQEIVLPANAGRPLVIGSAPSVASSSGGVAASRRGGAGGPEATAAGPRHTATPPALARDQEATRGDMAFLAAQLEAFPAAPQHAPSAPPAHAAASPPQGSSRRAGWLASS